MNDTCFLLLFGSQAGERLARIVVDSLRAFGGPLRDRPVLAFGLDTDCMPKSLSGLAGVECQPLVVDDDCPPFPLAAKVYACARAEEMAGPQVDSLVLLSLDCLVLNPPVLFDLGQAGALGPADAAFRPVHHRNVGSLAREPLDGFWRAIYSEAGLDDAPYTVTSFADGRELRPYFNTHCFAWNPATGLAGTWWRQFKTMVTNEEFQQGACRDELHKVFLHQALLSALVARLLERHRVRLLPPEYNYPLNLLGEMRPDLRVRVLNGLVNAVYEDAFPWSEIEVEEPLHTWLKERLQEGKGT